MMRRKCIGTGAPLSAIYIYSGDRKPCFVSALHRKNSSSIDTGALPDAALVGGILLNSATIGRGGGPEGHAPNEFPRRAS